MKKLALLIGVSHYQPGFNPLPSAERDIQELQRILRNPEIGGFDEVTPLLNPDLEKMQESIETIFRERERDDLILLFFSGHGIKDEQGKLYLATSGTKKTPSGGLVKASAVPASFVYEILNNSRSKRQVVMLDCCFSGAFAEGMIAKDDGRVAVLEQLGGEGRAVLTSSTSTQYSYGQQGSGLSVYTQYIVEGLETGAADEDNDGTITIDELHKYAKRRVQESAPAMKPEIQTDKEGFRIKLARALVGDPRLRYRREVAKYVEKFAERGELSDIVLDSLDARRQKIGLSVEEADAIRDEVLKPLRIYEQSLKRYERHYRNALQQAFPSPLSPAVQRQLENLQEVHGLRDEDIKPIVSALTGSFQAQLNQATPAELTNLPAPPAPPPFIPQPPIAAQLPITAEIPAAPQPQPVLPSSPTASSPPARPVGKKPVLKGLLAAGALLIVTGLGAYGYRSWQMNQAGGEVLQQATILANTERWEEAIAYLNQIPTNSAATAQAQAKLEEWSNALLKQAQAMYAAGDVEGAIAKAQSIPQKSNLYNNAQNSITQWQQEWASDQAVFAQIQKVLDEQWDVNTARTLLPQLRNSRLKTEAEARIGEIDQKADVVQTQQQIDEERRKREAAERQLAKAQLLSRHPDPSLSESYQYAWLSQRPVTDADLMGKSSFELYVIRNSIYARHGRIFQENDLKQVFSSEPWYRPVYTSDEFRQIEDDVTSSLERANAGYIRNYEERTGLCYGGC